MEPVLVYLLKMLICSAVLYGYYRIALYNERFHQWNRFYLLGAMVLSVLVPFIHIPVMPDTDKSNMAALIASMPWNAGESVTKQQSIRWQDIVLRSAVFVSAIFFVKVLVNITKIVVAYYSNPMSILQHKVQLIVTKLTQAPFSFFNWLFWRSDIDPASAQGQRILNHELTHIYEHHSIDKLFTSLLLCIFWMNPFFWLMRIELYMIHEFLADRKAVNPQDRVALAEMILQALPFTPRANNSLVNPFFSSQIKRRLLMISTSKDAKYNYLRRVSGLVLMVCSAFTLTLSIRRVEAQKTVKADSTAEVKFTNIKITTNGHNEISITSDTILFNKKTNEKVLITSPVQKVKLTVQKGNENQGLINKKDGTVSRLSVISKSGEVKINDSNNQPIYLLDGKEIDAAAMKDLDGNVIKEINVLKGENAINKYGEKGKNGVIEIKTKTKVQQQTSNEKMIVKDNKTSPLYYLDGKEVTKEDFNKLAPGNIESVTVLKGDNAIKKYGEKGKDGVVEILMKKPVS